MLSNHGKMNNISAAIAAAIIAASRIDFTHLFPGRTLHNAVYILDLSVSVGAGVIVF